MRPPTLFRTLVTITALVATTACAKSKRVETLPTGCPSVLLTRTGGLGFQSETGLIGAVWSSGTIIRADSPLPGTAHMIGTIDPSDLAAFNALIESPKIWDSPLGEVVREPAEAILTLRRNTDVRQWSETPGFTITPAVGEFRSKLFSVPIAKARRFDGSLDDVLKCASK